jgi:hypothetical protein
VREGAVPLRLFVPVAVVAIVSLVAPVVAAQEPLSCGPKDEKHVIIEHKGEQPVPAPSAGKAMVVVVLGGSYTKSYQQKLAVNGQWRAVMKESQYSFFEVDPGALRLAWCGRGGKFGKLEDTRLLITARPGETYYLRGTVRDISEVDPVEGQKLLRKKKYVTFEVRNVQ